MEVKEPREVIDFLRGLTFDGVPGKDWNEYINRAIELVEKEEKLDNIYHQLKDIISSHSSSHNLKWLETMVYRLEEEYFSKPRVKSKLVKEIEKIVGEVFIEKIEKRFQKFLEEIKEIKQIE